MRYLGFLLIGFLLISCNVETNKKLPILGRREAVKKVVDGTEIIDTAYQQIADFRFVDQDSTWVNNETFANGLYVADFFFTSCPSICPVMKKQMLRVYEKYNGNPDVAFLSHTIDPRHDSVAVLHEFAQKLGVSSKQWHFVTGKKDDIYTIAQKSYMVATVEDENAAGGFIHGGNFVLVDNNRHIRGVYDGTDEKSVDKLMEDIEILLNEIHAAKK